MVRAKAMCPKPCRTACFGSSGVWDAEAASWAEYAGLFAEQRVRQAFVRKVLAIVFVQLLVTALASAAFYLYQPLKVTYPALRFLEKPVRIRLGPSSSCNVGQTWGSPIDVQQPPCAACMAVHGPQAVCMLHVCSAWRWPSDGGGCMRRSWCTPRCGPSGRSGASPSSLSWSWASARQRAGATHGALLSWPSSTCLDLCMSHGACDAAGPG